MTQPSYQTISGGFPLSHHLEMILDGPRVASIRQVVDLYASADKSFLELGIGAGLFLEHARHKYAEAVGVEMDPVVREIANNTLAEPGPANWRIVPGDAREVHLDRRFDVILCEMLSTWCIVEPQVSVVRDALKRHAAAVARIIPARVVNLIEVGYTPFGSGSAVVATPYLTLMGVRAPTILSLSKVAHTIDFTTIGSLNDEASGSVTFEALVDGQANCVRLTSLVELAPGINWYSSDTLMPPMVYPLRAPVVLKQGTPVSISYKCHYGLGLDHTAFWAIE